METHVYNRAVDVYAANIKLFADTIVANADKPGTVRNLAKMIEENAAELRRVAEGASSRATRFLFDWDREPGPGPDGYINIYKRADG